MGRPTKLTEAVQWAICDGIRRGLTFRHAAALAGVHVATFCRWRERGREAMSGRYRDFCDAVEKAETECRVALLGVIRRAATEPSIERRTRTRDDKVVETVEIERPPDWHAAAWNLERRYPAEFGRRFIRHEGEVATTPPDIRVVFTDTPGG